MCYYRNPRGFSTLYEEQPSLKRVSVTSHKIDVETDCGCYRVGHVVNIKQHVSKENCSYHPTTNCEDYDTDFFTMDLSI